MPAPPNTTMATAISIGTTLPVTITADAFNSDTGTASDLWYYYDSVAGDRVIGVFGIGGSVSSGYRPTTSPWTNLASPDNTLGIQALMRPFQVPVTVGTRMYFKAHDTFGTNANPSNLTLLIQAGADQQLSAGQLAINDSTVGFPAVIMDSSTAEPIAFRNGFAAGEGVSVLLSGIVAALDYTSNTAKIYNPDLTLRATATMPAATWHECLGTNQVDTFWAGKTGGGATHGFMVAFDRDGTVGTPLDVGSAGLVSLAPYANNSAILFTKSTSAANTPVLKITNPGATVTTFLAGVANYTVGANLFMLTDDTVLVPYERVGFDTYIEQRDSAGVLLKTFTLSAATAPVGGLAVQNSLERIFGDPSDPAYFWIWYQDATKNYFERITVATGVRTFHGSWVKFVGGISQAAESVTPTAYFGADFSCVPWILRGVSATTTYTIRRQRRFLLPSSPDNRLMYLSKLELLMRTGIGLSPDAFGSSTPQGANPQVMLRLSRDGGKTWGPEQWRSAGEMGEYLTRVRWLRQGRYRNAVCEVTVSDPVDWQFISMIADIAEGRS